MEIDRHSCSVEEVVLKEFFRSNIRSIKIETLSQWEILIISWYKFVFSSIDKNFCPTPSMNHCNFEKEKFWKFWKLLNFLILDKLSERLIEKLDFFLQ